MNTTIQSNFTLPVTAAELTRSTLPQLTRTLNALTQVPGLNLTLDLSAVTYADSSAVGLLVQTASSLDRNGGQLLLSNASPAVALILKITRLTTVIPVTVSSSVSMTSTASPVAA